MIRIALDTNVLAYAEGVNDAERRDLALNAIGQLQPDRCVLPAQVLGELMVVLTRKGGRTKREARDAVLQWCDVYSVVETSPSTIQIAADLAADHHMSIWDAVIMASAFQAKCRYLFSEDLNDGFTWGGVTVVNPFSKEFKKIPGIIRKA